MIDDSAPSSLLQSDMTIEKGLESTDAMTRESSRAALREKIAAANEAEAHRKVKRFSYSSVHHGF